MRDSVSRNAVAASWPAWMAPGSDADDPTGGGATLPTPKVKNPEVVWPSAADSARQSTVYSPSASVGIGATNVCASEGSGAPMFAATSLPFASSTSRRVYSPSIGSEKTSWIAGGDVATTSPAAGRLVTSWE